MESYYTKEEYNKMKNSLSCKIRGLKKRILNLETKNKTLQKQLDELKEVLVDFKNSKPL